MDQMGDISSPNTSSVCGVAVGELGVGGWWGLGGCSTIVRVHIEPRWHAGRQLTTPSLLGATKGHNGGRVEPGERYQHPKPNPPALYICAEPVSKARPPFFPLKSPLPSPSCTTSFLFSHCYSAAGERTSFCSGLIVSHRHKT